MQRDFVMMTSCHQIGTKLSFYLDLSTQNFYFSMKRGPGCEMYLADTLSRAYLPDQRNEQLQSHELPSRPWQKLGIDLFEFDGNLKDFLCVVDFYSDYFEVEHLPHNKTAHAIIVRLKRMFAGHGIPDLIISDNGPPFNSLDFAQFMKDYEITHKTSSPRYARSNGKAESAVKIATKKLIAQNK